LRLEHEHRVVLIVAGFGVAPVAAVADAAGGRERAERQIKRGALERKMIAHDHTAIS